MNFEELRNDARDLVESTQDEQALERVVEILRGAVNGAKRDSLAKEKHVSFDADGRGYTAAELGDTLDERVKAMRRGEDCLPLDEFIEKRKAWRKNLE